MIDFDSSADGMMHPMTYLNKLVVWCGRQMCLYNVVEGTLIHKFKPFESEIKTVVQSPVLDVVGVGLADGSILLFNLRYEEQLIKFQ